MIEHFDITIEKIEVTAGSRPYEARLYYPDDVDMRAACILAPPHRYLGGNFDNNVITALAEALAGWGFIVLTYNLPGVGSTPERTDAPGREKFWDDTAYGEDLPLDVRDFGALGDALIEIGGLGRDRLLAGGYSYGAAVALLALLESAPIPASTQAAFRGAVLVSTPLAQVEPDSIAKLGIPSLMIYGEDDLALEERGLDKVARPQSEQTQIHIINGADHFYLDHMEILLDKTREFIESHWLASMDRKAKQ